MQPTPTPEYRGPQQPGWEMPLEMSCFLLLLALLSLWYCGGLDASGTGAGRGNLPGLLYDTGGLTSIRAALSGEPGLWPGARTKHSILVFLADLCGCFSLLGRIFLLTKIICSLFFFTGWSYFVSSHHKMLQVPRCKGFVCISPY